jgi:hypothetical protein
VNVPGYVNIFRGHHAAPPDRLGETPYPRLAAARRSAQTVPDQRGKAEEFAAEAVKYLGQEGGAGTAAVWAALANVVGVPGRPGLNNGHRSSLRSRLNVVPEARHELRLEPGPGNSEGPGLA